MAVSKIGVLPQPPAAIIQLYVANGLFACYYVPQEIKSEGDEMSEDSTHAKTTGTVPITLDKIDWAPKKP